MIEYDIDDFYYILGDYIYKILHPEVKGDLDQFKYILGKLCSDYF